MHSVFGIPHATTVLSPTWNRAQSAAGAEGGGPPVVGRDARVGVGSSDGAPLAGRSRWRRAPSIGEQPCRLGIRDDLDCSERRVQIRPRRNPTPAFPGVVHGELVGPTGGPGEARGASWGTISRSGDEDHRLQSPNLRLEFVPGPEEPRYGRNLPCPRGSTAGAEGMIQQIRGHADLPIWSLITQLQVESACPRFSSPRARFSRMNLQRAGFLGPNR